MHSLKYIVVFSGYSAASSVLSPATINSPNLFESAEHQQEHWAILKPLLDDTFPGINCNIDPDNNLTEAIEPNPITSSIQTGLTHIHPAIRCIGNLIEKDVLNFVESRSELEKRRTCPGQHYDSAPEKAHHGQDLRATDIDSESKAQNAAANAESKSAYVACRRAPHPDACVSCWTGFTVQLASEIGICSLVAYKAIKERMIFSRKSHIWIAYTCCIGACTGKFVALSSGCGSR